MKSKLFSKTQGRTHTYKNTSYRELCLLTALLPAFMWGIYLFGARVITLCLAGIAGAIAADMLLWCILCGFKTKKAFSRLRLLDDCFIGCAIALMCPSSVPLFLPTFGAFFGVMLFRELLGNRGNNIFNPCLGGIVLTELVFGKAMNSFVLPFSYHSATSIIIPDSYIKAAECSSPLQLLVKSNYLFEDGMTGLFVGISPGKIGEVGIILLIAAAVYMFIMGVGKPYAGLSYAAFMFVFCFLFSKGGSESTYFAMAQVLSGGVVFLSVFACSDAATTPHTTTGQVIFGLGCGVLTYIFRTFITSFDGAYVAVLIMNLATPIIDRLCIPMPYGIKLRRSTSSASRSQADEQE